MKLYEIAKAVQGTVTGDSDLFVVGLSPIDTVTSGYLVYAEGEANIRRAEQSEAAALLTGMNVESSLKPLIQVQQPFKAFIQLIGLFYPPIPPRSGIHPTAIIAEDVVLGTNVAVGPYVIIESGTVIGNNCVIKGHVHIGHQVVIGADSTLHPHVTVYDHTQIGARVSIHASTVIGSDGFGYSYVDNHHMKVPHAGRVIIEDDVEIGASTVVDRATLGATVIGAGTKIDNFVQIAHSVQLGKHNILCAFTGIAGSTTSGDNVVFAANVGVSDHVRIDSGVVLGARAGVPPKKHLLAGNIYLGNPARPRNKALENELSINRIPGMRKNQKILSEQVKELSRRVVELQDNQHD